MASRAIIVAWTHRGTVDFVELRILGPLAVHDGGSEIPVGGARARALLARLLVARGQAVPLDTLVSALWDGEPPRTARQQVHKVVSDLRRRLPGLIETVDGVGYRARLDDHRLDADEADELLTRGDPSSTEHASRCGGATPWTGSTASTCERRPPPGTNDASAPSLAGARCSSELLVRRTAPLESLPCSPTCWRVGRGGRTSTRM